MKIAKTNLIYGMSLISFGFALFLKDIGIVDLSAFYGFFLLVPGIMTLSLKGANVGNIVLILVGSFMVINEFFSGQYILPMLLIFVGFIVMFSKSGRK